MIFFIKKEKSILCLLPFLWLSLTSTTASAKENPSLKKPSNSLTERKNYTKCRKQAILRAKKVDRNRKKFILREVNRCREQFPVIAIFTNCKKNSIRKYKYNKNKLISALRSCRMDQKKMRYNPKSEIPFFIKDKNAYFAGADLNTSRQILNKKAKKLRKTSNDYGNFSCSPVEEVFKEERKEEYILFGNHPNAFKPFRTFSKKRLMTYLKPKKVTDTDTSEKAYSSRLGQLYNINRFSKASIYFPTSYCYFANRLGSLYEGLKVYYLLDNDRKNMTPYFGIAFYKKKDKIKVSSLIKKAIASLGSNYKAFREVKGIIYLAKKKIRSFDDEKDPFNLCELPREHRYIGIIKVTNQNPEYILLANVNNLCNHGDSLAKNLLKRTL